MNQEALRLLIVEDEQLLRDLLRQELAQDGVAVEVAEDGEAAYQAIQFAANRAQPFDAILSDIMMPKKSGLELLRELRQENCEIPFVLLTAFGDQQKAVEALRFGAYDFLDKPYDLGALRETMRKALSLGRTIATAERQLEEQCARLPAESREAFRQAQKALLRMRSERAILFKKAG